MIAGVLFLTRRAVTGATVLLAITACTFVIFFKIPANPAAFLVDLKTATPQQIAAARHELGVDRPVLVQFAEYVRHLTHGDLGVSWLGTIENEDGTTTGIPVRSKLDSASGVTGSLLLGGIVVLLLVAIPLGTLAAARPDSLLDRLTGAVTLAGISLHPLVLAIVLQTVVASRLGLFHVSGYCSLHSDAFADCSGPVAWTSHLALPWVTFAAFFTALYTRMVKARMLEVLDEPWTQTARAKGSAEWRVLTHHALPNALPPVIAMVAMDVGTAAGIAIYVETVYGLPGIGRLLLQSLQGTVGFDLPMIAGIVLLTATVIVVFSLLVDVVILFLDPTVAHGRRR
jgi:peptide/nickel transport system permease protein